MKSTYLVAVSVLMVVFSVLGLLMATVMYGSLPEDMPLRPVVSVDGYRGDEHADSARWLAGDACTAELDAAARIYDMTPRGHDAVAETRLAAAIQAVDLRARQHAMLGIAMLVAVAIAGALGLVRLVARGAAAAGGGMLAATLMLAIGALAFSGGAAVAIALGVPCVIALAAQAIAANLLAGEPSWPVASLERDLRALPPAVQRRTSVGIAGAGVALIGAGGLLAAIVPSLSYIATAAVLIVVGGACILVPAIVMVRRRIADAGLPAARIMARRAR